MPSTDENEKRKPGRPKGARNGIPLPQPDETAELVRRRQLWPVSEAAYQLGMHRVTLYRRAEAGDIRIVRVGKRAYVTDSEIRRFVANVEANS